jgi:hypothetical protein
MDQIHLSPLVDQIQLSLGHISNIYTLYAHLKLAELAALSVVDPLAILAANAIDFITPAPPSSTRVENTPWTWFASSTPRTSWCRPTTATASSARPAL